MDYYLQSNFIYHYSISTYQNLFRMSITYDNHLFISKMILLNLGILKLQAFKID